MAVEKDIRIEQGDSKKLIGTLSSAQDGMKVLNLVDAEVIWELYQEPHHKKLITKSSTDSADVIIVTASEGLIHIIIQDSETSALKAGGDYKYYIRVKDSFGQTSTVTKGRLFIEN